ncbi:MAG: hypothetical protein ABIK62_06675 [candidate division WOR-3 bacterium]
MRRVTELAGAVAVLTEECCSDILPSNAGPSGPVSSDFPGL